MTEPIRIAVFQPLFSEDARLDYRLLGLQMWLADRFSDVEQLEGASMLQTTPAGVAKGLIRPVVFDDTRVQELLGFLRARFGLLTSFAVLGGVPHLATARLVEYRREPPVHTVARWKIDRDGEQLPAMAHFLFGSVLRAIAEVPQLPTWQEMFGTSDVGAATNFLTAVGVHSTCLEELRFDDPQLALRAVMSAVAAGMRPAIGFVPVLCGSLRSSGSASEALLRDALRDAIETLGGEPEEWIPLLRELGISGGHAVN